MNMKRINGNLSKDGCGQLIQSSNGFVTYGHVPGVKQVGTITGVSDGTGTDVTVHLNNKSILWPMTPTTSAQAQVNSITGLSRGKALSAGIKIDDVVIPWSIPAGTPSVQQVNTITGYPTDGPVTVGVHVNAANLSWDIPSSISAVSQVDTITGVATDEDQVVKVNIDGINVNWNIAATVLAQTQVDIVDGASTNATKWVTVTLNSTPLNWHIYGDTTQADKLQGTQTTVGNITLTINATDFVISSGNPVNMGVYYETLLAAINADAVPVTATYINNGNHATGLTITADVAGTPYTISIAGNDGTLALTAFRANRVYDVAQSFTDAISLINTAALGVTAAYVNSGDHAQGITVTANVSGTPFTLTLSGNNGTLVRRASVTNIAAVPFSMATAFTTLAVAIVAAGVTSGVSYITPGNHADGLAIEAPVAGIPQVVYLDDDSGTLDVTTSIPNRVATLRNMGDCYEDLKFQIESVSPALPVLVEFINPLVKSDGIKVIGKVGGTIFTCTLSGENGSLATTTTIAAAPFLDNTDLMYAAAITAVNASTAPVTASYINGGNHSLGIFITADVAGSSFVGGLLGFNGTVVMTISTPNVVDSTLDMGTEYEGLLDLINECGEKVVATFVTEGTHSDGITLTSLEKGKAFTCSLVDATGDVAYLTTVVNTEVLGTKIQSPVSASSAEVEVVAPKGAVSVILHGDANFIIDSSTGVDAEQGMVVKSDIYLQLPIAEKDSIFVYSLAGANVDFTFLTIGD
jgi:hypothetical protein